MIAQLTGKLKKYSANSIIINVRGVGYKVFVSQTYLNQIQKQSDKITLFIHTYIREDKFDLYGFTTKENLNLFQLIINISGIGPKTGLILLDKGSENIIKSVSKANVDFFKSIPGIGKKTAQTIIIELKPKLGDLTELDLIGDSSETKQIIDALASLGFKKQEARNAIEKLADKDLDLDNKIKQAIKLLGQNTA